MRKTFLLYSIPYCIRQLIVMWSLHKLPLGESIRCLKHFVDEVYLILFHLFTHYAIPLTSLIKSLSLKSPLEHQFFIAEHSVAFFRHSKFIGQVSQGHSLLFSGPV